MDFAMKSFCIFGGFLLLSMVELEASSISQFACQRRTLTVTADGYFWLYIDGIEIKDLPNRDDWERPDVVDLPCATRLIAIHGQNGNTDVGGILASTDNDYVLTNSSWKCSNESRSGWTEIDFDDSDWMSAKEYGHNGEGSNGWVYVPGISTNASWIWLRQYQNSTPGESDLNVSCRKKIDACDANPCQNGGTCTNIGGNSITCTCPIYATGVTCESPNYNEAYACGTTLTWSQYDAANDFTRLCYFWTQLEDTEGRFTQCRDTIKGIPLYDDYIGLLNAGGNFGCVLSQNYPDDIPATSYLSCADNYQQDAFIGNVSETDRLMVCIRYPYEGIPGRK